MTKDETTGRLLATLKRHNPFKVRVFNGEDDAREVAVPTRRKRWSSVIEAVDARAWTRCVLLDKSGAELAHVENEGQARELEELGTSFAGVGGQLMLGERIAMLAIKSMRDALAFRDQETVALLKAQGEVVREMSQGVRALAEVYREQNEAYADAADARVQAASEAQSGDMKQLLEALPQLLQLLPIVKALVAGEQTKPNGARPQT